MANDSEEKPNAAPDVASSATSILDYLNDLRKWREKEVAECRKKLIENEISLQLSNDNQKKFEINRQCSANETQYQHSHPEEKPKETVPEISDVSSISLPNDLDICDTLQESSITGHLQRCFNDSTYSNTSVGGNKIQHIPEKVPVFSELRNPQFPEKNLEEKDNPVAKSGMTNSKAKPKHPFLKKGSGLLRFMPKSTRSNEINSNEEPPKTNKFPVKKYQLPQKTLKLKPALRKVDVPSEKVKHIRFDITDEDIEAQMQEDISKANKHTDNANFDEEHHEQHSIPTASTSPENKKLDSSNSESESFSLSKESRELEEFEMLENYAQNNSFSSDSSLVQRILQGGSAQPPCVNENDGTQLKQNMLLSRNEIKKNPLDISCPEKVSLNKCLEEVRARKQILQGVISDINPRIESLQKEISCDQKQTPDEDDSSDCCSTPVNVENENPVSECDSNIGSSIFEISPEARISHTVNVPDKAISPSDCTCCNVDNARENFYPVRDHDHICSDKEECACNYSDEDLENELDCNGKSKIRVKLLELQKEIETYQNLNARLSSTCKERDDIVRKLQKERDDFNKYKEAEMQKLESHIQEERRQIKRQKETFMRYQKLRKDNPTKKERDELSSMRLEIDKLHDELKRQKIKYNNDSRRWKTRTDNAEKERDTLKFENIRLQEQCEDLIAALKARMKKNLKSIDDDGDHIHDIETAKTIAEKKDAGTQTEAKNLDLAVFQDSNDTSPKFSDARKSKCKTPFTLVSGKNNNDKNDSVDSIERDPSQNENFPLDQNDIIIELNNNKKENLEKPTTTNDNLSTITVSSDFEFREIKNGNLTERIYSSGEREIIYNSGTRKIISADGKSKKFSFYNGDIKEILSDGKQIYTYVNGVVETTFPDGLKVTKFPNGQIQRHYPNGEKEIRFPDGILEIISPDGSEEIHTADGHIIKKYADGTKITEFANGQREIETNEFKRREFPDGSVRIIYFKSGNKETRYSYGRVKIKDTEGNILLDTKLLTTSEG